MEVKALTVTELNNHIKTMIDGDALLASVAVAGELSNYKIYPSGHHYFTLKDAESSLRCVMFKTSASKLRFTPQSGMGVIAVGRVTVYPRDGAYQLYCTDILPEGAGALNLAYEQLKEKLFKEGLFDAEHKKPIPRMPGTIAVITSSAGAAVRDIIRVLGKRWPMSKVVILPVRVQGEEAPPEIVGAIKYANKYKVGDLIITGRGGGSIEDLWAFNDERVARAIYESEIPIISAVGHEPDVTIADYVADLRAATPSNGAELAVPDEAEVREALAALQIRASQAMSRKLSQYRSKIGDLASRKVMQAPTAYIDLKRMELQSRENELNSRFERVISRKKHDYVRLAASMEALSPLKVLSRGYSVVSDENGGEITDARAVSVGERVRVRLHSGSLSCLVEDKQEEKNGRKKAQL